MNNKIKAGIVLLAVVVLTALLLAWMSVQANRVQTAAENAAPAGPPMDPVAADKVLDKFLGDWNGERTTYAPQWNPSWKHATYRSSITRVLGGRFVQETSIDSENISTLGLLTYDQQRKCYRRWLFSSDSGGPDVPFNSSWNEANHTFDSTVTTKEYSMTIPTRFVSDDLIEVPLVAKDMFGNTTFRIEFKMTRMKESQNPSQPAPEISSPVLGQTPEQKVLDRLLGTWSQEATLFKAKWTPEEKHTTGTFTVTRILGGAFVQSTGRDSENNSVINLWTYNQQRKRYQAWSFGSDYGGPNSPANGKWNEATQSVEYSDSGEDGQTSVGQMHFVDDDTVISNGKVTDATGEVLMNMEFKITRIKGAAY